MNFEQCFIFLCEWLTIKGINQRLINMCFKYVLKVLLSTYINPKILLQKKVSNRLILGLQMCDIHVYIFLPFPKTLKLYYNTFYITKSHIISYADM